MLPLNKKAILSLLRFFAVLAVVDFVLAGTIYYWQASLFLAAFFLPSLAITLYLIKNDPKLLERRMSGRMSGEKEKNQKVIRGLLHIFIFVIFLLPPLDKRFGWSNVPPSISWMGDFLILAGYALIFLVFKENSFASATVELDPEQKVVSTGPYALVRHPMYSGALVLLFGVPLALGSWWGLLALVPVALVLRWRLIGEEKFLADNLPGYTEYLSQTKFRLAPNIW